MTRKLLTLLAVVLLVASCAQYQDPKLKPRVSTRDAAPVAADGTIEVLQGDTVYAVSRRYNVPITSIVQENNLPRPYVLQPGTRIRVPAMASYTVQPGDTAETIAMSRGITSSELMATNSTASITAVESMDLAPMDLKPGDVVRVPAAPAASGTMVDNSLTQDPGIYNPASVPVGRADTTGAMGETHYQLTPLGPSTTPTPVAPAADQVGAAQAATAAAATSGVLEWPLEGRVLKTYGKQPNGETNDGINIAAPRGTPVTAAAGGTVIHAGSGVGSLGNLVLIRHQGGMITAYGHLDRALVDRDSIVAVGDVLGTVGESGGVKVPQLHFQVRQGETLVDPMGYLPAR